MNLLTTPWIPTPAGLVNLQEALSPTAQLGSLQTGSALADAALLRLLAVMVTRAGAAPAAYLEAHQAGLHLHGDWPFMQVPAPWTARLPDSPIHALTLLHATGRDITFLNGTLDSQPQPVAPSEAVRRLLTYHAFAPTRGITRFKPSRDAPLARVLTFHAHGDTLAQTLQLNAPPLASTPPTWEQAPDWTAWVEGREQRLDATTAYAWPWRSATLVRETSGDVQYVKLASGPVPVSDPFAPSSDDHTLQEFIQEADREKRGRAYDQARNPPTREARALLVQALRHTLNHAALAPLGFRRALLRDARRVSVTGLSSRNGQPVLLGVVHADLPWPTIASAQALEVLLEAQTSAALLERATRAVLKTTDQGSITAFQASPAPRVYWEDLWPTLSAALVGEATPADVKKVAQRSAETALDSALMGDHPARRLGLHILGDQLGQQDGP